MKIKRIETLAISLPMVKPLKMSFEEVKSAENVLVRMETGDGVVGWGGAATAPTMTGETVASMAAAIRYLAPMLEGMPLDDIAAVMVRAGNYLYGNNSAKSVIEMALHDALGRARREPVYDLLGGKRRSRVAILRMVGTVKGAAADVADAQRGGQFLPLLYFHPLRTDLGFHPFHEPIVLGQALDLADAFASPGV